MRLDNCYETQKIPMPIISQHIHIYNREVLSVPLCSASSFCKLSLGTGIVTANLRTKILDFGGFDSCMILILRGGIPRPMFPGNHESTNLSRDNVTREIGRTCSHIRPFFILRIVRPRIFESKFRNYCAKKLDGALRKSTSFV